MDTNGDHGANHQKTTQFVLKKPPTAEKNADFTKTEQIQLQTGAWRQPPTNENSVDPIQPEAPPKLEMFAVSRTAHSEWKFCCQAIWRYN